MQAYLQWQVKRAQERINKAKNYEEHQRHLGAFEALNDLLIIAQQADDVVKLINEAEKTQTEVEDGR